MPPPARAVALAEPPPRPRIASPPVPAFVAPTATAPRPPHRPRRDRALLVAVASAAALLGVGLYGLVAVGGHQPAALHATRHAPTTTTAPAASSTVPSTAPDTTPTTAPATAQAGGPVSGSTVVVGSGGGGGGGGGGRIPVYLPATIVDPSPVATAVVPSLPLYSAPDAPAPVGHLANPNWLGAPLTLLVTAFQGDWVQAYIPVRPIETVAWFPRADVAISSVPYHITVSISAHELVLYKDNAPVFRAPVATGAPDAPTPTGSFFIAFIVKLTDPWNAYGPYAMGTSDFSNTYYSFEGGPGQVGIHGTNQPWVIGTYASHGCIRLNNNDITTLAQQVVPGTPVEIGP